MRQPAVAAGIFHLTYISRETHRFTENQLHQVASKSEAFNSQVGITGFLIYSRPFFIQSIEGSEEAIRYLYAKIERDPRHRDCIVLSADMRKERMYENWSMQTANIDSLTSFAPLRVLLSHLSRSYSAMRKYLPMPVTESMVNGLDPTAVPPRSAEMFVLVTDIVSFTTITEKLAHPEAVSEMVNAFVDAVTRQVELHHGVVLKFLGDCVTAYFERDRASEMLSACLEILAEIDLIRAEGGVFTLLNCGVGIGYGTTVLCSVGQVRKDCALFGPALVEATSMETCTREEKVKLLLSKAAGEECLRQGLQLREVKVGYTALMPDIVLDTDRVAGEIARFQVGSAYFLHHSVSVRDMKSEIYCTLFVVEVKMKLSAQEHSNLIERLGAGHAQNGVTGTTIYAHPMLFCTLEGREPFLFATYTRAQEDPAIHRVTLLLHRPTVERKHPEWDPQIHEITALTSFGPLCATVERLGVAMNAMKSFLPQVVANALLLEQDPSALPSRQVEIFAIFTHTCGFSELLEVHGLATAVDVVNTYAEICANRVLENGGELCKFIGDGVLAYFPRDNPAGLSRCLVSILTDVRGVRMASAPTDPKSLFHVSLGVAFGKALMCPIGSRRCDYTLMGNTINTAARVQSMCDKLQQPLLVCDATASRMSSSLSLVPCGSFKMKGKTVETQLFALDSGSHPELMQDVSQLSASMKSLVPSSALSSPSVVPAKSPLAPSLSTGAGGAGKLPALPEKQRKAARSRKPDARPSLLHLLPKLQSKEALANEMHIQKIFSKLSGAAGHLSWQQWEEYEAALDADMGLKITPKVPKTSQTLAMTYDEFAVSLLKRLAK